MATTTALGRALQTYKAFDFSGGLDVDTAPTKLALLKTNARLSEAHNVIFRFDGAVETRTGTESVCRATTLLNAAGVIQGGVHYVKSDGTDQMIVAIAGHLYKIVDNTTVVDLKSGLTSNQRYSFAIYNDTLFIANGVDAPMQYDGTTVTALGGGSPATLWVVVVHGNRLFGFARAVPSRLYWSKLNNPLDWTGTTDAGFIDINPNDGGTIRELVSSINELVILKNNRTYRLQGIGPTTGYTVVDNLVPTTGSTGCQWPGAAVFAGNEVWYVSREGVHTLSAVNQFGDLEAVYASRAVRPYFQSHAAPYDTLFKPRAGGLFHHLAVQLASNEGNDTLVLGTCSRSNTVEGWDRLLVYDRGTKAWATWRLGTDTANGCLQVTAMWPYKDPETGRNTLCLGCIDTADNVGGFVVKLVEPDGVDDDSTDANGLASPAATTFPAIIEHVSSLGAPNVLKVPRHLFLYFREDAAAVVDVSVYYDSVSTPTVTATNVILGSATDRLGVLKRLDLWGDCEFLRLRIESASVPGAGPWMLLGYEVQWRPRRYIRRGESPQGRNYALNSSVEAWDAGTSVAPTSWAIFGAGATIAKDTVNFKYGTAAAAVTRVGADCLLVQNSAILAAWPPLAGWVGKVLYGGAWARASVANTVRVAISDNVSSVAVSAYHSGSGNWEWLTAGPCPFGVTGTMPSIAGTIDTTNQTAQFDGFVLTIGAAPSDWYA